MQRDRGWLKDNLPQHRLRPARSRRWRVTISTVWTDNAHHFLTQVMYIAGLYLSHAQGIESIVCLTTVAQIVITARQQRAAFKRADSEGGSIVKLPESFAGRIVTPIHGAAVVVPILVYFGSVIINGLVQPAWIERWRLPEVGVKEEAWARTAARVAALGITKFVGTTLNHLGKQFHFIGVSFRFPYLGGSTKILTCCMFDPRSVRSPPSSQPVLMVSFVTLCTGRF
jgi:hypothetical protein